MAHQRREVPNQRNLGSNSTKKARSELREAWSSANFKKNRTLTLEQRFVLEVVHVRRTMRLMEKMDCAAELELKKNGPPDLFALDQLRRTIDGTRFD
ncbi:hypothetical protein BTK96_004436 [Burkholderia pyrrocinia]|uniref:hypothetical protein n=1 Tax=Burkholderia TaxID=32008 RepID=UPI001FB516CB|nr:hypothetical protein [Burkholderia pyrrocinia]EKS9887430.1 hypothetical protein [Burkholderia pyrrocinia]EKS9897535.1 hypothetical protein [Burkholderia pyrrocinia]EKS9909736.1 hypothetical protein [Burkholderia pyrrocinia]UOB57559.1 hypothetical protein MRS60_25530 [Burkholderia pyrrocinia]